MGDNMNIGNKLDAYIKTLTNGGKNKLTPEQKKLIIDFFNRNSEAGLDTPLTGWNIEHTSPQMKYGANIPTTPTTPTNPTNPEGPQMKYGANTRKKPKIKVNVKYGVNAGDCNQDGKPKINNQGTNIKYGANIGTRYKAK